MVKKFRRVRTFARTASKSMEKNLIENALKLKNDPYIVLPEYTDSYSKKCFKKIKKGLDKINKFKDDVDKLEKFSNKRDLDSAVAGTLLIAHSKKAPYLAVSKFSMGDITYAQRGKADKEKLIASQHFDNPVLRLLGIKDLALKKNLHIYSWDNGFLSSGLESKPPKEFIKFVLQKTGFEYKDNIAICNHLSYNIVKNKKVIDNPYLYINWKSAEVIISVCKTCTNKSKNTIFNLTKFIIEPNISNDFSIEVIGQLVEGNKSFNNNQTIYIDEYLSGKITDLNLIEKNMKNREKLIEESEEKILILDGKSYGSNTENFINALKPNKFEKKGLDLIIKNIEKPIVLKDVTPNKVLEYFWKDHGLNAILSIVKNKEMAKKFYSLNDIPSEILEIVFNYIEREDILSKLPKYKSLPPLAYFADNIAKTYKTYGENKSILELNKRPDNHKGKSLSYAFLLVFEKEKDKKWQYSKSEIESGEFLLELAKKFLHSKPKEYHKTLKELIAASGSSEDIDPNIVS